MDVYEIIICSNGSTDDTVSIGRKLESEHTDKIIFIEEKKRGVGLAFKHMVERAKYDKLISLDADLTTDLQFIPECIEQLDRYSLVLGSKRMGEQYRPLNRIIISKGYFLLVKILMGMEWGDYSIGVKGYRKNTIKSLIKNIDSGSSYVMEIAYKLKHTDGIVEIPVFCKDTRGSKFNIFSEITYRFFGLLKFIINKNN